MGVQVVIRTVDHQDQRYPTSGDWMNNPSGSAEIRVSDLGNDDYTFLVALHEFVEWYLCRKRGISQEVVDRFDLDYDGDEPGDDPRAPYHREHDFASVIERAMAHELGVEWAAYNARFEALEHPS
jgi:hypothetical protein